MMSRDYEILVGKECADSKEDKENPTNRDSFRFDIKLTESEIKPGGVTEKSVFQNAEGNRAGENLEFLRKIIDNLPEGIVVADEKGIVFINDPLVHLLGYNPSEELNEIDTSEILSPEDDKRWKKFRKIYARGNKSSFRYEFQGKHKTGILIDLEATFSILKVSDKKFLLTSICRNCENRQESQLIKESSRALKLVGDSILHQVWSADAEGQLDYINARALEYRGLSMAEAIKQVWQEAVHPDDVSLCVERWERSLRTGEPYEVEFRLLRGDGKYRWHLGRANARRDENGKVIKWFGTNTDINEQKLAEESFRKSEERFQLAARATNDVMWDWDIVANQIWWNEGIHVAFGYPSDEVVKVQDKLSWWRERIHSEDKERVILGIQQFLAGDEQAWKGEYRYLCADGSFAAVIDRRIVLRDEYGIPLRMVGSLLDITERRQTEQALIESEQRLQQSQKMEAIGTLTGGVAHDFNNLLTAIIGNTQLALCKLEANDPLHHRLREIEKATNRAVVLTRQLLAFSRRQHLERRTINLNDTIAELMKLLQRIIGEDVEVSLKCAADLAAVFADTAQIEQVIMNLCVNAREAMPAGGVVKIETNNIELDEDYCRRYPYIQPGKYVQIKVSDNGCGMDDKIKERIFEPFFTTKEMGRGTGLGLSIAYGIVKQHEGYIKVHSEKGKGSSFEIFLPVDENAVEKERQIVQPPLFGGTETILVAEDEEALRNLAQDILGRLGYTIIPAKNGEEAVKVFAESRHRIDLLLFDMIMPRMGGAEAYERIKDLGSEPPLIFMTGYSSETFQNRFVNWHNSKKAVAVPVIQKPYNVISLGHKVREVLDINRKILRSKKFSA